MRPVILEPATTAWPSQLDDLEHARPARLWASGTAQLRLVALRSVAIVGARNASAYGIDMATTLATELAAAGWTVVSGAANGIDAAAHRGALLGGGATVAVMAGGVDVPLPRSAAPLLARITESGCVIAESPPGAQPRRHSFLERNRLIAALTRATIVVEAGHRSGSLNTADWASLLGRRLLAVPGPATSMTSRGTHRLIRQGVAELVQDADDVIEALAPVPVDLFSG